MLKVHEMNIQVKTDKTNEYISVAALVAPTFNFKITLSTREFMNDTTEK